jgi:hypothetical protein
MVVTTPTGAERRIHLEHRIRQVQGILDDRIARSASTAVQSLGHRARGRLMSVIVLRQYELDAAPEFAFQICMHRATIGMRCPSFVSRLDRTHFVLPVSDASSPSK